MENTHIIVWKSKSRASVGRGKAFFSREEADRTAKESIPASFTNRWSRAARASAPDPNCLSQRESNPSQLLQCNKKSLPESMKTQSRTPESKHSHIGDAAWAESEWFRLWLQFARGSFSSDDVDADKRTEPQCVAT